MGKFDRLELISGSTPIEDRYEGYLALSNPPTLNDVSDETLAGLMDTLPELIAKNEGIALAAGFVYDRKGYLSARPIREYGNSVYPRTDELDLQITIRVRSKDVQSFIVAAVQDEDDAIDAESRRKAEEIDAQIAELKAKRDAL